ncbi:MAG: hypothetical protein A4E57_04449 [Syntrophorhabdaceae bacterium PtaU1.Bin034]|nr:MAG: hypothetical protein A4E57_04449 [Syntrophorhabdaceae bacterium PtaU1.Bin034]
MKRLNLVLLVIASVFLVAMLHRAGWDNLAHYLRKVSYYWPLVLVPYGLFSLLGALSWKILLPARPGCPTFTRLFLLRLAGESINQLTPTASLGGEPYKALRLHFDGIAWQEAVGSIVIHKGIMVLSLVLYIILSVVLAPFVFAGDMPHPVLMAAAATLLVGAGAVFVMLQLSRPCISVIELLKKLSLCPAALSAKRTELAALDSYLAGFYREHFNLCLAAFCLLFLGWGVHAMEVYIVFRLLDHPVDLGTSLCFDGLASLFACLGFVIPGSLGVQDGGNVLLSLGLSLGATFGAAFSIIRRLREGFWLALGLLVISLESERTAH